MGPDMGKTLAAAIPSRIFLLFMDFLLLPASAPNSASNGEFRAESVRRKILPAELIFFDESGLGRV
jgi:hypothetical protein